MSESVRPVLVYDGGCGFCRRWIERWRHATGERVEYAPSQYGAPRFPRIPPGRFARSVVLIEPDGRASDGAEAVFRALSYAPDRGGWLALYKYLPLFAPASEAVYRFVARHRDGADRVTDALWGAHVIPPGEARTVELFLRLLGLVYAIAFVSLWTQVTGLVGEGGILPVRDYLDAATAQLGPVRYRLLPTLCWFAAGDSALHALCAAGTLGSALAMAGFAPLLGFALAWVCYLSLAVAGQVFLQFQWDGLLLETGFIALLLAPRTWRTRVGTPPSRAALWLARWLLFRLVFSSAVVKLTSGDPTWRSLTALDYHYFTQPLPPWTAWYAHHLPPLFQRISVIVVFGIEGIAPFGVFGPRRVRFAAASAIAALQALVLVSGNYGFFNILTLVLCVPLLDDAAVAPSRSTPAPPRAPRLAWRAVAAAILVAVSLVPLFHAFRVGDRRLGPLGRAYRLLAPFHIVNGYGLFAAMTTDRPEIVVEGSRDGRTWKPYEFRYKPGDVTRRPPLLTPHMPRLDWQMWFAALGDVRGNRWVLALCRSLLEGSSEVTSLFARDPFEGEPPRYLRTPVYLYRFTTPDERRRGEGWWSRTPQGSYAPALTLVDGKLAAASDLEGTD
jgi:predicted DCC family thiol-disulfide oxidoreductase YuxK